MSLYTLTLADDSDTMSFTLLEIPISDPDVTGVATNTTLDGNVFQDYLYMKKQYQQSWSRMSEAEYTQLRGFFTRQYTLKKFPLLTMTDLGIQSLPVALSLTDDGVIDTCGTRQNVKLVMRETTND